MARYKITQSLLSAWNYAYSCSEDGFDGAMKSFLCVLRCEPEDLSEEQQEKIDNGIAFESMVYATATGAPCDINKKWAHGISQIADIVMGSQFQVRIHKPITVNGMRFEIHGVLDALRAGVIYDIKFKNKSFSSYDPVGDYRESPQHPFYFYLVPNAEKFIYVISDGDDIYLEQYLPEETVSAEKIIAEFMHFLESSNLMDTYKAHWQIT